jgi:hypothetical protein
MSNNCIHCGKTAQATDNYCAGCGRPLTKMSNAPQLVEAKYEQAVDRLEARLGNYPKKIVENKWLYTIGISTLVLSSAQIFIGFFEARLIYLLPLRFLLESIFFGITLLPLLVCMALPSSKKRNVLLAGAVLLAIFSFYYNFL